MSAQNIPTAWSILIRQKNPEGSHQSPKVSSSASCEHFSSRIILSQAFNESNQLSTHLPSTVWNESM